MKLEDIQIGCWYWIRYDDDVVADVVEVLAIDPTEQQDRECIIARVWSDGLRRKIDAESVVGPAEPPVHLIDRLVNPLWRFFVGGDLLAIAGLSWILWKMLRGEM